MTISNALPTKQKLMFTALMAASLLTTGCTTLQAGANHRPIVDGGDLTHYEQDLASCQALAKQRNYLNDEVKQEALIGASVGAVLGLVGGDAGDATRGAVAGGTVGAGSGALDTRTQRKNIVINCMRQRGYNTVESTGVHS